MVEPGKRVVFHNGDASHHVLFTLEAGSAFEVDVPGRGASEPVVLDGDGPLPVFCKLHPDEGHVVLLSRAERHTLVDAAHGFQFQNLAPGAYRLGAIGLHGRSPERDLELAPGRRPRRLATARGTLVAMRVRLSHRFVFALGATAALATGLTLAMHARTLSAHLGEVARDRLDRSAGAALTLLEQRQDGALERTRAVARTPEFRANLATAHAPTLARAASDLRERSSMMRAVLFTDRDGERVASNGGRAIVLALAERVRGRSIPRCAVAGDDGCSEAAGEGTSFLLAHEGELLLGSEVPLFTAGGFEGRLVVGEAVSAESLASWSALAGAELVVRDTAAPRGALERVAVAVGDVELRIEGSLAAEEQALAHLYRTSLAASTAALGFAFALAVLLSRSLVRPIRTIEHAAQRIASGDRSARLRIERHDELGDVARAFDTMLDHLETTEAGLRRAQRIGQLGGWSRRSGLAGHRGVRRAVAPARTRSRREARPRGSAAPPRRPR